MKGNIVYFLSLLIFFPFVGFFPGVDVQPTFILFLCCVFCFFLKDLLFDLKVISAFLMLTSIIFVYAFMFQSVDFFIKETFFIVSFFSIYIGVRNGFIKIEKRTLALVFLLYTAVGVIQLLIPDFLAFLVSRSAEQIQMAVESGRGVRSLTGEPSQFGKIYIIINIFLLILLRREPYPEGVYFKKALVFSLLIFSVNFLLARSLYMLFIHLLLIALFVLICRTRLFILLMLVFSILVTASFFIMKGEGRVFMLLDIIKNDPSLLLEQGAFRRLVNIPIVINNISIIGFFGVDSLSFSQMASLKTPIGDYRYYAGATNLGGAFEIMTKYGIIMFPFLLYVFFLIFNIFYNFYKLKNGKIGLVIAISVFIVLFQDGSISNPLTIFLLMWSSYGSIEHRAHDV